MQEYKSLGEGTWLFCLPVGTAAEVNAFGELFPAADAMPCALSSQGECNHDAGAAVFLVIHLLPIKVLRILGHVHSRLEGGTPQGCLVARLHE